jgi:hypothetical protein
VSVHPPGDPARFLQAPELPPTRSVVDAHVHLFPPGVFAAPWRWFESSAYRFDSRALCGGDPVRRMPVADRILALRLVGREAGAVARATVPAVP